MSATPFGARLAAVMVAVVLAASMLVVTLNYMKFRRVLRTQEDLVYLFIAHDLAAAIEDGMNLGLPLAALQTTDPLIRRRRTVERGTLGITVFDSTGTVLFDTDRFRVGGKLPQGWSPPLGRKEWRLDVPGAYLVGAPVINNFGQPAGGVAVRYDTAPLEARMNAILLDMVRAGLGVLAVCAGLAVAAGMLLTRRYRAWLQRATAQVDARGEGVGADAEGAEGVMAAIRETSRALDAAEAELMRLGTAETAPKERADAA